jgi:hypothetical protein
MSTEAEIRRLLDVMPASARMRTKLIHKPEQRSVLQVPFPLPWMLERPIWLNLDLWSRLSRPERDLLILRSTSWLTSVQWFRPELYQGIGLIGGLGAVVQLAQGDAVGTLVAGGLSAIAVRQIWQTNRSTQRELQADEAAIQVAQRRGYTESEAVQHLLSGVEAIAEIEGRSLNFTELLRCQNLRSLAGLSTISVPSKLK